MHLNKLGQRFLGLSQENGLAFFMRDAEVSVDYLLGAIDDEYQSDSGMKVMG